jgi:hypothetical protein
MRPLSWLHGPRLCGDNENDRLIPNGFLDAFSQCASDCRYVVLGISMIHRVGKTALPSSSLDLAIPVVLRKRRVETVWTK